MDLLRWEPMICSHHTYKDVYLKVKSCALNKKLAMQKIVLPSISSCHWKAKTNIGHVPGKILPCFDCFSSTIE